MRQKIPSILLQSLLLYSYKKYDFLCHQGDELDGLYFLVNGKLQVDQVHLDGKQAVFSFETPFSIIGDLELLDDQEVVGNVQAIEDSHILYISIDLVREKGLKNVEFLQFIIRYLSKKLYFSSNLLAQSALPVEQRLARYLLFRLEKEGNGLMLENRESIAAILGTSIRHLNRTLKEFRSARVVDLKTKKLSIINLDGLREIAEKGL